MKKLFFLLLLIPLISSAQNFSEKHQTKYGDITSKNGQYIKFVDFDINNRSNFVFLATDITETRIRILLDKEINSYFYMITDGENNVAQIEYSDVVEINKAMARLMSELETDLAGKPEYLENKYVTQDDFVVGYYISNGKAKWFFKLDKWQPNSIQYKKYNDIKEDFLVVQRRMEELMKKFDK